MEQRDKLIQIRVTEEERETARKRAGETGLTVSAYVRSALTGAGNGAVTVAAIDTGPINRLVYEMVKEGTNLNAIARKLNSQGAYPDIVEESERIYVLIEDRINEAGDMLAMLAREAERGGVLICSGKEG